MAIISIQKVTHKDIHVLQEISMQTFNETFSAVNTEENMKMYLRESFSIEKLSSELNDANAEFYFALLGSTVIGYLKLNFGTSQTRQ